MAAAALWPVPGARLGQRWRALSTPKRARHLGVDIPTPIGTPVRAPWAGSARISKSTLKGGCFLQLEHRSDVGALFWTEWLHLRGFAVLPGELVSAGAVIAESGNTGSKSTGPHVHLQVRVSAAWLRAHGAGLKADRDFVRTDTGYFLDPMILLEAVAPAPLAIEDEATADDEIEVAGIGMTAKRLHRLLLGSEPPRYKIKLWCEWQGTQAAVRVALGYTFLAAAFGLWPFRARRGRGTT